MSAPNDPTLALDLSRVLEESKGLAATVKPGRKRYDVIVVGSGAAGGMAAYLLTQAGLEVLMLEAGRMLDGAREYRTMEWPYASLRRNRLPPTSAPSAWPSTASWTVPTATTRASRSSRS